MNKFLIKILSIMFLVLVISGCTTTVRNQTPAKENIPKSHYSLEQWFSMPTAFEKEYPDGGAHWKSVNPFLKGLEKVDESQRKCQSSDDCISIVVNILNVSNADINLKIDAEGKAGFINKFDPLCVANKCYLKYNYLLYYSGMPDNKMTPEADYSS